MEAVSLVTIVLVLMDKSKISNFEFFFFGKKPLGFTFIELLLSISMVIIFSGLSLASYHQFKETKKLEAETKKLVETLELAKKKIISGDKANFDSLHPPYNYSGCNLTAYKVVFSLPNQYSIQAVVCGTGSVNCDILPSNCETINIRSYTSPENFTISLTPLREIAFNPFNKVSFFPLDNPPLTYLCITITNNIIGKTQFIKVDQSGIITIVSSCS